MRSLCPLPRTGRLVFKLDQIVFEDKSYVEYMSYMAGRDYSFSAYWREVIQAISDFRDIAPDTERLKGFILTLQ